MAEGQATRRLAAILVVDVVGYSRLMEVDEAGTLDRLKAHRQELIDPKIVEHRGRIIKLMGDGTLVEFASVVDAVACAVAVQRAMRERNAAEVDARRIEFRIGVNLGDLIVEGDDLYGDGLNVAARLEGLADPGGVCISAMVYQNVKGKLDFAFEDLGEQQLKNLAEPVHAFRVRIDGAMSSPSITTAALPLPDKPSIAVLPFTNMSGDPEQEYFSDGITEDVITELSRFRSLFVIARNSSFSYKGRSVKVQEIGRDLGVAYVVEGSVRKAGNRVRVTAQLIEAPTGNHLWAERYDRNLDDIFAVQDELVQSIVTMIPGRVDEMMLDRSRRKPTDDMTAYDCLLRAEWILNQRFADPEAQRLLEMAIEIDPRCARAYCRLAGYHAYSVYSGGIAFETAYTLADRYARMALEIDPGDASVHMLVAITSALVGKHDSSQGHLKKAIFLNPNDLMVLQWSGPTCAYLGDLDEAIKRVAIFLRSNPLHTGSARECFVDVYYMAHRYQDAIDAFKDWHDPPSHMWCELAAAHAQLGQKSETCAAVTAFENSKPEGYDVVTFCRTHARMCRRPEDAEHWLEGYRKAGLIA